MSYTRIKTIRSHAELARYMANLSEDPVGTVPRTNIRTPYAYSEEHVIFALTNQGDPPRYVFVAEVQHRVYHIYEVTPDEVRCGP